MVNSAGSAGLSSSVPSAVRTMTREERRQKRRKKQKERTEETEAEDGDDANALAANGLEDRRFAELLAKNEDQMLEFVARVNKVYKEKLNRTAPFMTFVFCGMQSAGKSTIMERFMNAVMNIVQEGTGTRCPLDTTCIHDASATNPTCDLSGKEIRKAEKGLSLEETFKRIVEHNKMLASEDRFSTEPLNLVYRAKNVQNMRFVDTPGIISNQSTGKDNRDDIKHILRSEMKKPNTKLCVILEPKEFATNPIIDFCDRSLGGRNKWIDHATFLMTKFDKKLEDSRTGSKANAFFREFAENNCFPHLVITPTLPKEDLPPQELFKQRRLLLSTADTFEADKFEQWIEGHEQFLAENEGNDELLDKEMASKVGFKKAKAIMREILLRDTVQRLPEVISSLRTELDRCIKEREAIQEKMKFNDPNRLKDVVLDLMFHIKKRIFAYLNGDLESSMKFPEKLQTLFEELESEEESEWAERKLNFYSEKEDMWRDRIAEMQDYPSEVQAESKFLGGKQYQRAVEFFRVAMIDALPDPFELEDFVANGTGYLAGGLNRENWEGAMVQITRVCIKDVSHPGINFLIKHVGCIFRRLFAVALDDVKQGEEFSSTFKLLPPKVEKFMNDEFDQMLWSLMQKAAETTHVSLEPMYTTIDPSLPTFHADHFQDEEVFVLRDGRYESVKETKESYLNSLKTRFVTRMASFITGSGGEAKSILKRENYERAMKSESFLSDERTSMLTKQEAKKILSRAFEYMVALLEFCLVILKFQLNHTMYEGFKIELERSLTRRVDSKAEWDKLVEVDDALVARLEEVKDHIAGVEGSLHEVQRLRF